MSPLRVLIVRIGAMGDVLHALPAVAALREHTPLAEIDWVIDTRWAPLLVDAQEHGPVVSRIHRAETRLWSRSPLSGATLRSLGTLRRSLRQQPYDAIIDMQGTLRSAVIGRFARGAPLAGYADPKEAIARYIYRRAIPRTGTHVVAQGAHLLSQALGLALPPLAPALPREEVSERWADALLSRTSLGRPVALLAPTAGWRAKQWPAAYFGDLARRLTANGWTVLVNAAQVEDATGLSVAAASGGHATIVAPTLGQLIALVRRTRLVIGGDSGPLHLAATLGTPLVALFGPTDPARNGPWGPGPKAVLRHPSSATSYRHTAAVDPGLARLTVDEVLAAEKHLVQL